MYEIDPLLTPSKWFATLCKEWTELTSLPWHFFSWDDPLVIETLASPPAAAVLQALAPHMATEHEVVANAILCRDALRSARILVETQEDGKALLFSQGAESAARNHWALSLKARQSLAPWRQGLY